ncbi:uncharacterized protein LOC100120824 isoform X1 [Nasonia vitripennis]|uniref:C-type lectin domain-containing protein n=1 Tax=Nasonia vitripennis TaxID=7425 RepID=A0A7M7G9B3_NASVI|nr:uncharacterized protein LOC100120824 isoform X1 [Nasonia vitripennis]
MYNMLNMHIVIIIAALCHCASSLPYEGLIPTNVTHNFVADHQTFYFGSNIPSNNATPEKTCEIPVDYDFRDGFGAYKFHNERVADWNTARKACIEEGAHLAVPRSKAEEAILKDYIAGRQTWVGFYALFDDSEIYSVLDEPVVDDVHIRAHSLARPSGESIGDRCVMVTKQGLVRWFCGVDAFFICKIDCKQ